MEVDDDTEDWVEEASTSEIPRAVPSAPPPPLDDACEAVSEEDAPDNTATYRLLCPSLPLFPPRPMDRVLLVLVLGGEERATGSCSWRKGISFMVESDILSRFVVGCER